MSGYRVAVVGGGIGGLCAAAALGQAGIEATVFEQAPALAEVGAGVSLWANALRVLDSLGLGPAIAAIGGGPPGGIGSSVRRPDGRVLLRHQAEALRRRWGHALLPLLRSDLQAVLAGCVDPVRIRLGRRCTGIERRGDAVAVLFDDGSSFDADIVVGADGIRSFVRRSCFAGPGPVYRGYTCWRGVAAGGGDLAVHEAIETWGRGARFGLQPGRNGQVLWYACRNAAPGGRDVSPATVELKAIFGDWHDPIPAVLAGTPDDGVIRTDIYDRSPSRRWVRGRVALIGDAAHAMTPDLGQGACQAIVDAMMLARCLGRSRDAGAGLREYQRRRRLNVTLTTLLARGFGWLGQLEGAAVTSARDGVLARIPSGLQLRQLDLVMGRPLR